MSSLDISLCMIVKDEEEHLERCLSSVQGVVSEIIIGDTGSKDQTMTIARRFGARILQLPWEDDFAKARNETLKQAVCSWILVLDADEVADRWLPDDVALLLDKTDITGYFLQLINYLGEDLGQEYVTDSVCRLFRNDPRIRFRGKIHEEVAQSILELPDAQIPFSSLLIKHYGYLQREIVRKDKNRRNLDLIERALMDDPEQSVLQYALGTEYFQTEQYDTAASLFIPLLKNVSPNEGYLSDLYLKTVYALKWSGHPKQAEEYLKEGLSIFPDFTDLLEAKSHLLMEQNRLSEAYLTLQQVLMIGDVSARYTSSSGSGTYRSHLFAGNLSEKMFRFDEAADHYYQAIALRPDYFPAWREYVPLCLFLGQSSRLASFLDQYPEFITPKHLSILIPAALNSRSSDWVGQLLKVPSLDFHYSSILYALRSLLEGEQAQAILILNELQQKMIDQPMVITYLWALAWGTNDPKAVHRWFTTLNRIDSRLQGVQHRLVGDIDFPLDEPSLVYGMQLFVQTGAWETMLHLYKSANEAIQWTKMPQSLLYGLHTAPDSIKKELCLLFETRIANDMHLESKDLNELVFFSALSQSYGEFLSASTLKKLSQLLPASPAVQAAMAYYWLACAGRFRSGLPSSPMNPSLLLRACLR